MDKFKALEPVRLHSSAGGPSPPAPSSPLIGRLPAHVHALVLDHLPLPDVPAYARACRALGRLCAHDALWAPRYARLAPLEDALDALEARAAAAQGAAPPTLVMDEPDDFGDFSSSAAAQSNSLFADDELGDFVAPAFFAPAAPAAATVTARDKYRRACRLLAPLAPALLAPPHLILDKLFAPAAPPLQAQARILHVLLLHLAPAAPAPLRRRETLYAGLRAAADRFDAALLTAFEAADAAGDEEAMRAAAAASWEVWAASRVPRAQTASADTDISFARAAAEEEWELGRTWAEKREVFYTASAQHRPADNFVKGPDGAQRLDFGAMDAFLGVVLASLEEDGRRAVRVFPPQSRVLLAFAHRLANDVVGEYITPLLTQARALAATALFLRATAAAFGEAWRMVDALVAVAGESANPDAVLTRVQAEDVVYRMFEPNMDEYLDEEVETLKHAFDAICAAWDRQVAAQTTAPAPAPGATTYNKRSVLASFADALLTPVAVVPRAVGGAAGRVGGAAVQGIAMLDPRRWAADASGATTSGGYTAQGSAAPVVWGVGDDEDDDPLGEKERRTSFDEKLAYSDPFDATPRAGTFDEGYGGGFDEKRGSVRSTASAASAATTSTASGAEKDKPKRAYDHLQLLLSLDVTLELIHGARDSLKRAELFARYPAATGRRVQSTIEDVAAEMLGTLAARHVKPGFAAAIAQMRTYAPPAVPGEGAQAEKVDTSVAPLVQFFELVHVGDMIQSIVQVYFDKELAPHVDTTDFLNTVVREKKRFENVLDDSVAQGLNAGIEVLMNQVDHIILALTPPRAYYPPDDAPLLLGPSAGCSAAIACLEGHVALLRGNVNREVLEVFETELGARLIGILQKHIKRQIISLSGGFQVIADLNAYHAFIASLKIPALTADFANLKMLGHVYIVEDAKDLAQIVRDVTRYGGAYRPEDVYEFVQRRSDWKRIEKVVDKTMYNLNLKEDCIVC